MKEKYREEGKEGVEMKELGGRKDKMEMKKI